jgi:hypothetical protein
MSLQIEALGMVWYKESDYDRCKALFTDGHKLPLSFLQWKDQAEQGRKRFIRAGKVVVQAYIDPDTFPNWCAANSQNVDASGRMAFANAEAYRVIMERNKHQS